MRCVETCTKINHSHCILNNCSRKSCSNSNLCAIHCESETHSHCKEPICNSSKLCKENTLNVCVKHCEKLKHSHCIDYLCDQGIDCLRH